MISVDNSVDLGAGVGTSLTVSFTNAGDILFVGALATGGNIITGITFNGVAMTPVASSPVQVPSNAYIVLYYLKNPFKGTANIVVSTSSSTTIVGDAVSYNAPAISGIDVTANNQATATTSIAGTVTTTKDNAWTVVWCSSDGFTLSAGAGTTLRQGNTVNRALFDSNAAIHPAGSKTLNVSMAGSGNSAIIICDFYETPASGMMASEI